MLKITGLGLKRAAFHESFLLHRAVSGRNYTIICGPVTLENIFKHEVGA